MLCPPLPDRSHWLLEYVNDDFYRKLNYYRSDIVRLLLSDTYNSENSSVGFSAHYLGRETQIGNRDLTPRAMQCLFKELVLDSFYIIDYIRKNSLDKIYDLGCGSNAFKYFFDDIIGIDKRHPMADIQSNIDDKFFEDFKDKLPNAISINALHNNITFQKFKKIVENFSQVISTGGYGYITFNIFFLVNSTKKDDIPKDIPQFILNKLSETDLNIINVEFVDATIEGNNSLDGNIRILFRK